MGHDGTAHSDGTGATARQVVDLYDINMSSVSSTDDLYKVGDALIGYIEDVDDGLASADEAISEIESEISVIALMQRQIKETQDVVARMIFELNEIGIDFQSEDINKYMFKYLKK